MLTALLRAALKSIAQRVLVLSYGKSVLAGCESNNHKCGTERRTEGMYLVK